METILILKRVDRSNTRICKMNKFIGEIDLYGAFSRSCLFFLANVSVMLPQHVFAQELGQQTIKVGEADLYTTARFGVVNTDNAFRSESDAIGSAGFRIAPSVTLVADRRGLKFTAGYNGEYARFDQVELDYNDHTLAGSVDVILGTRKRFSALTNLTFRHEKLGTGLTRGSANVGDEQVQATDFAADANYIYGAPAAKFNVTGGVALQSVAFQNRSDLTEGSDYSEVKPYGRVSYRLSSDTRALVELGLSSFDFDNDFLDRSVVELLAGLSFQGTGKARGQVKIGVSSNNYDDSRVEDTSVLVANVNLTFSPSAISRVDVNFNRKINDNESIALSNGTAQTIGDTAVIRWRRNWSGFVKTVAYASFDNQDRDCRSSGTQTAELGLELSVLPRRWVEIGAGVSSTSVTADNCGEEIDNSLEYDLTEFLAFVRIFP